MKKLPRGLRKHIRTEKARIRRENLDLDEQNKLIKEMKEKFLNPIPKAKSEVKTKTKSKPKVKVKVSPKKVSPKKQIKNN